jgi:hypothetical protein
MSYYYRRGETPPEGMYQMILNMEWKNHRTNPSELARTMFHEWLHRRDEMGMGLGGVGHRALDAEARRRLKAYGLGAGGCSSVGDIPLFGPAYPGCN